MSDTSSWHAATIVAVRDLTEDVRLLEIQPEDFESYVSGSHIDINVVVNGEQQVRSYSLIGASDTKTYRIAVKRLQDGRGGSRYIWSLAPSFRVSISRPKNHFDLSVGGGCYLLMAGGIGITPIYGMALDLLRMGADFRVLYAGRSLQEMPFSQELKDRLGDRLQLYPEDTCGRVNIEREVGALSDAHELYVCGPVGMLEAVKRSWRRFDRDPGKLRFETFGAVGHYPSEDFVVSIRNLGVEFVVPRDQSLLDAIEGHGIEMISNCRRGECGVCAITVISSDHEIDHRDVFLSDQQKVENRKMCACVSRATGGHLLIETSDR